MNPSCTELSCKVIKWWDIDISYVRVHKWGRIKIIGNYLFEILIISLLFTLQLYEIDDNPKRKEFLDELFTMMQKRGKINRVCFEYTIAEGPARHTVFCLEFRWQFTILNIKQSRLFYSWIKAVRSIV